MMKKPDAIEIEVLPDGTIKIMTDKISQANHVSAEKFLEEVARLTDGATARERRSVGHVHAHDHAHDHHHHSH